MNNIKDEEFKGLGYRNMGKASPYVWSEDHTTGKYVADGKYQKYQAEPYTAIAPGLMRMMYRANCDQSQTPNQGTQTHEQ